MFRPLRRLATTMATPPDPLPTLTALQTIGLPLVWHHSHSLALPAPAASVPEPATAFLGKLARAAQTVSARHLLGSLLAGPDSEADDALDIPLLLGSPPDRPGKTLDWLLARLGLAHLDPSLLTIREPFEEASAQQQHQPWVLARLSACQVQTAAADPEHAELETLLAALRPRLSLEIELPESPNRPVCLLVGPIPQALNVWGGLISYRVSS